MSLKSVCRIKIMNNGFAVEYPNPVYATYFKDKIAKQVVKSGGVLEVTVAEPRETDNQAFMRLFHMVRDAFAKEYNEPKSQVEANFVREFGVKEGLKKRLKAEYGAPEVKGKMKSLVNYTRAEWIVILRGVITEAMEQGIWVDDVLVEFQGRI